MIQTRFHNSVREPSLLLKAISKYFQATENQRNWLKNTIPFEERAKQYFERMLEFYQKRGGNGSPILEIRDPGNEACPTCFVQGAMLVFREYGIVHRRDWDKLREEEPPPRLNYYCFACETRCKETTDRLSFINFTDLPLADLPYSHFEFQVPEWVYLLECCLHNIDPMENFIHPKDCPNGYSIGILVQAYPPNEDWNSDFKRWNCLLLLTSSTHYKAPFEIDPFAELYSTSGYRIMKLDDPDLTPLYELNLNEEKSIWNKKP